MVTFGAIRYTGTVIRNANISDTLGFKNHFIMMDTFCSTAGLQTRVFLSMMRYYKNLTLVYVKWPVVKLVLLYAVSLIVAELKDNAK